MAMLRKLLYIGAKEREYVTTSFLPTKIVACL
jgi:hypothetical protein